MNVARPYLTRARPCSSCGAGNNFSDGIWGAKTHPLLKSSPFISAAIGVCVGRVVKTAENGAPRDFVEEIEHVTTAQAYRQWT